MSQEKLRAEGTGDNPYCARDSDGRSRIRGDVPDCPCNVAGVCGGVAGHGFAILRSCGAWRCYAWCSRRCSFSRGIVALGRRIARRWCGSTVASRACQVDGSACKGVREGGKKYKKQNHRKGGKGTKKATTTTLVASAPTGVASTGAVPVAGDSLSANRVWSAIYEVDGVPEDTLAEASPVDAYTRCLLIDKRHVARDEMEKPGHMSIAMDGMSIPCERDMCCRPEHTETYIDTCGAASHSFEGEHGSSLAMVVSGDAERRLDVSAPGDALTKNVSGEIDSLVRAIGVSNAESVSGDTETEGTVFDSPKSSVVLGETLSEGARVVLSTETMILSGDTLSEGRDVGESPSMSVLGETEVMSSLDKSPEVDLKSGCTCTLFLARDGGTRKVKILSGDTETRATGQDKGDDDRGVRDDTSPFFFPPVPYTRTNDFVKKQSQGHTYTPSRRLRGNIYKTGVPVGTHRRPPTQTCTNGGNRSLKRAK